MSSTLEIRLAGQLVTGWLSASVFRSVEAVSGSFTLEVPVVSGWTIGRGSRVELYLDGSPFLVGHVEKLTASVSETARTIRIEGRDLTADLVDCSTTLEGGELYNLTLTELAAVLVAPFGLEVLIGRGVETGEPIPRVAWTPGESAWDVLEKVLRVRGVLGYPSASGALVLEVPETFGAGRVNRTLSLPGEILSLELQSDDSNRFRRYLVRGQYAGSDLEDPSVTTAAAGEAVDLGARASRVLILPAETAADAELCERRAQWEAATRAARSTSVTLSVKGWRDVGMRELWNLFDPVRVEAPALNLAASFLISSTRFEVDARAGERTTLGLARPDAFLPEPALQAEDPADLFGVDLEDGGE